MGTFCVDGEFFASQNRIFPLFPPFGSLKASPPLYRSSECGETHTSEVMFRMLLLLVALQFGFANDSKYLLISIPSMGKISYVSIDSEGNASKLQTLIDTGLNMPQGVAINNVLKTLYVADPDSKVIYRYRLIFSENGSLMQDGSRKVIVENIEARWVAVDGMGNLFFTDESKNTINKVSQKELFLTKPTVEVLYDGNYQKSVSIPGGIAADNFFLFWSNKVSGNLVGSLVRAEESPDGINSKTASIALAKNGHKIYGVCLSQNNVFYTDHTAYVYGVKKSGGSVTVANDQFVKPRGCAWDGDGTVFVADNLANAVYSFPGNAHLLSTVHRTKVIDCEDAFGLAVISNSASRPFMVLLSLMLMLS